MEPQVQYRDMIAQVLIFIVTLGIYGIYWFYVTSREMKVVTGDHQAEPGLWTILLFIPFANLYAYYKHAELYEKMSTEDFNRWLSFVLWLVFSPAVWFIVQSDLNRRANAGQVVA